MIAGRTLDVGACLEVLTNPEIFEAISEDGATHFDLKIDVMNDIWLDIIHNDELIGIVQFKPIFSKCFEGHIHILPKHRKNSQLAGKAICDWLDEHLKGNLIYTTVPVICGNVKKFLLSFGFKENGFLEKAWSKNGKLIDMWILTKRF